MKIAPHSYGLCGKRRDTELRCFLPNAPQFGKRDAFSLQKTPQGLRQTMHCGAAIKVRSFWWEKSDVSAAMFSSAVAFFAQAFVQEKYFLSTVFISTVQYNIVQCSTILFSAVQ